MAGSWIWFRNYLWRKEVGEDITLFMDGLMFALTRESVYDVLLMVIKAYPAPLKTILRTEETIGAHL